MTETAEVTATAETTDFQRAVLRAMLELAGSHTSNEIATRVGVKPEPVRASLARMRDNGLIDTEVNPDKGGPPLWHLRASVDTVRSMVAGPRQSANDGTPGDDEPAPEPGDTQAVDAAEAAPVSDHAASLDEAPLIGEDVNSDADVLGGWCADHEMAISPRPVRGDDVAMIVSADGSVSADMPALRFAPPATGAAVASGPCPTVALLIQRASPVAEEAAQRAVAAAEAEALLREKEANIALDMARDARVRGRAVAEIIRFAEQRAGLAGDADPDAVLAAIVELLDGARSAVTGMSLPA